MKTKFHKNVTWLEPFFQAAKGLVPLHKIKIIKGFSVAYSVGLEVTGASCSTETARSFTIAIRTHNQNFRRNDNGTFSPKRHKRRYIYDILGDFAHELAHVVEWDHTPEHWLLECKIQRRFISKLKDYDLKEVTTRRPIWPMKSSSKNS